MKDKLAQIQYEELDKEQLIEKRNSLQNVLYYHKTHDLDEISFDNPKIGALLHQASIYGQININPLDNRKISIKIINPGYKKLYRAYDKTTGFAIADVMTRQNEDVNKRELTIVSTTDYLKSILIS